MGKAYTTTTDVLNLERPRSLWVDDRPDEISKLQHMLIHNGMLVDIVDSFHKAKEEVRGRPYDLMLLDLRLDESDGIKLSHYARQVISRKFSRRIHFIAVTNFKHEYTDELHKDGFTFVYEKDELKNGKSKTFVEDCLFSAADSRVRVGYPKLKEKLLSYKDQAFLSRDLARIEKAVPVDFNLPECAFGGIDREKIKKLLEEFNFQSLINRLFDEEKEKSVGENLRLW